jgi:hypothetical protein
MKLASRFILIGLACGLLSSVKTCDAIDIVVTGSWALTIDASNLTGGAGTDLIDTYESASNQVTVTISGTTGDSDNWRVDVKRTDSTWHNDFTLSVKRTGDGAGGGSISGGTAYQAVGTSDSAFFSGAGDRSDVPVQLELSGVSVQVAPNTYSTSVTYTVVDTA